MENLKFYYVVSRKEIKDAYDIDGDNAICISKSKRVYKYSSEYVDSNSGKVVISTEELTHLDGGAVNYHEFLNKYNIDEDSFIKFVNTRGESPIVYKEETIVEEEIVEEEVIESTEDLSTVDYSTEVVSESHEESHEVENEITEVEVNKVEANKIELSKDDIFLGALSIVVKYIKDLIK